MPLIADHWGMVELSAQMPRIEAAAEAVRAQTSTSPRAALVLGSGLGGYADTLRDKVVVPFAEIPAMPVSKVVGHAGNLVLGSVGALPVVAMQGRVHLYEGHPPADIVFGVRLMKHLGADTLLITNAAGGEMPAEARLKGCGPCAI